LPPNTRKAEPVGASQEENAKDFWVNQKKTFKKNYLVTDPLHSIGARSQMKNISMEDQNRKIKLDINHK
jgi:hypothetical protein